MGIKTMFKHLSRRIPIGHKYYNGPYHDGHATYTYFPDGNQNIFDGRFRFSSGHGGITLTAKGFFANDMKDGEWMMEKWSKQRIVTASANYSAGSLNGALVCEVEELMIGCSILWDVRVNIVDGMVTGDMTGTINGSELEGAFDEQGWPHGYWLLTTSDKYGEVINVECEVWLHGVLTDSWIEINHNKQKPTQAVGLFNRIKYMLQNDAQPLLDIIRHGVKDQHIRIG